MLGVHLDVDTAATPPAEAGEPKTSHPPRYGSAQPNARVFLASVGIEHPLKENLAESNDNVACCVYLLRFWELCRRWSWFERGRALEKA